MIHIEEQERLALSFLTSRFVELQELGATTGVTTFIVGFQKNFIVEPRLIGCSMRWSEPLLRRALEIGVSPTFYVTLEHLDPS